MSERHFLCRGGSITRANYWRLAVLQWELDSSPNAGTFKRTQPYTELLGSYMTEERVLQLPVTKYLWINLYWVSIKLCTIELKQKETSSWKVHYPNRGVHNILFFVNIMVCHVVSCLEHKSPVLYTCSGMWNFMRKTLEVLSCPVVWLDCENNMGEKVAKCLYFNGLQFSCFLMNFPQLFIPESPISFFYQQLTIFTQGKLVSVMEGGDIQYFWTQVIIIEKNYLQNYLQWQDTETP